jgi:hypothetical protein
MTSQLSHIAAYMNGSSTSIISLSCGQPSDLSPASSGARLRTSLGSAFSSP